MDLGRCHDDGSRWLVLAIGQALAYRCAETVYPAAAAPTLTAAGDEVVKRLLFLLPLLLFAVIAGYFTVPILMKKDPHLLPSVMIDKPAPSD